MVESTIDLKAAENHEFLIKAEFDPQLKELRTSIKAIQTKITYEAKSVANNLNLEYDKKIKLENNPMYGYCLRVNRKVKDTLIFFKFNFNINYFQDAIKIRGNNDYIEYTTKKDGLYFTTKNIISLSNNLKTLSDKFTNIQANLVKEVFIVAGE